MYQATPTSTKESNSPGVTSKSSPTASIAPDTTPVTTSTIAQVDSSTAYLTYTNSKLGFSLELPASWQDKYLIDESGNAVAFLHKESVKKSSAEGTLFTIIRYPGKMTSEQAQNGAGMRSLVLSTDDYSHVLAYPSGVEYTDETEDDYLKMSEDIASILKTVKEY